MRLLQFDPSARLIELLRFVVCQSCRIRLWIESSDGTCVSCSAVQCQSSTALYSPVRQHQMNCLHTTEWLVRDLLPTIRHDQRALRPWPVPPEHRLRRPLPGCLPRSLTLPCLHQETPPRNEHPWGQQAQSQLCLRATPRLSCSSIGQPPFRPSSWWPTYPTAEIEYLPEPPRSHP